MFIKRYSEDFVTTIKKDAHHNQIGTFYYTSDLMHKITTRILEIARYDETVLLLGETGVGKSKIAKIIHENSSRNKKPFDCINCSDPELFEATLFGHKKGAYTGAVSDNPGLLNKTNGGTLFFDEIGNLSTKLQGKLLTLLDDKRYKSIGCNENQIADVRFIFATNKNLRAMIKENTFKEDFYYRIKKSEVTIPPVRERVVDIVEIFFKKKECLNQKYGKNIQTFEQSLIYLAKKYKWPGNFREFDNFLSGLFQWIPKDNKIITREDILGTIENGYFIPEESGVENLSNVYEKISGEQKNNEYASLKEFLSIQEREYIKQILNLNNGNRSVTAKLLKISRNSIQKKIKKYDLKTNSNHRLVI